MSPEFNWTVPNTPERYFMKKEDIKKCIVLGVVFTALVCAVYGIVHIITREYQSVRGIDDIIHTIGSIVIIPISILVLFNIKLPKALRIPLAVVSILGALSYLAACRFLFLPDKHTSSTPDPWFIYVLFWIIFIIVYAPAIITFAIYAIRALRPEKK
jgi:hypothetical protein